MSTYLFNLDFIVWSRKFFREPESYRFPKSRWIIFHGVTNTRLIAEYAAIIPYPVITFLHIMYEKIIIVSAFTKTSRIPETFSFAANECILEPRYVTRRHQKIIDGRLQKSTRGHKFYWHFNLTSVAKLLAIRFNYWSFPTYFLMGKLNSWLFTKK